MQNEFLDIMREALNEKNPQNKLDTYKKALYWAEQKEDEQSLFFAKLKICQISVIMREYEVMFEHFMWCITYFDANERELGIITHVVPFLQEFKTFLEYMIQFPIFSLDKLEFFFEYYKKKCEYYDFSLRSYYKLQYKHHHLNGLKQEDDFFKLWQTSKKDYLSDSIAKEVQDTMDYLLSKQEYEDAFELSNVLLHGELQSDEMFKTTYSKLLIPLLKEKEHMKAKEFQEKGYFQIHNESKFLVESAAHILYFAITDPKRGVSLIQRYYDTVEQAKDPIGEFKFCLASWVLGTRCLSKRIHFPYSLSLIEQKTNFIANYFDERNKNNHFQLEIVDTFSLLDYFF